MSGLAAARDLIAAGNRVTVLDRARDFGGLASSVQIGGKWVERFYHFICRGDAALLELVDELGLGQRLSWHAAKTAFFYDGALYRFGNPFDLLRFAPIPLAQRVRFGLHVIESRRRSHWRWLDQIPAKPWVIESVGEEAYRAIWEPLLKIKFGDDHEQISAAWLWHRIHRVATSRKSLLGSDTFGVLEHGSATIVDELVRRLKAEPRCTLLPGTGVERIAWDSAGVKGVTLDNGETLASDAVLSTAALPVLDRLVGPSATEPYFERARKIRYIGVTCVMLSLSEPVCSNFWLNINDPRISYNGIISQTNLNLNLRRAGLHIAYVPFYLPTTHPRYLASDEDVYREVVSMLPLVNPAFSERWVKEWRVFRAPYAQAVCTTHFVDLVPEHKSPISGLYVTDSVQFYPEDRSISMAISVGRRAARAIAQDFSLRGHVEAAESR